MSREASRRGHWPFLGFAVAALVIATALYVRRSHRDDDRVRLLEQQLASVQGQLSQLRGQAGAEAAKGLLKTSTAQDVDASRTMSVLAGLLDQRLAGEDKSSDWTRQTLTQIQAAAGALPKGSSLAKAECGTTLCRVVVAHASAEEQASLAKVVAKHQPFGQGTYYHYDKTEGALKTTLYVVREGHNVRDLVRQARR